MESLVLAQCLCGFCISLVSSKFSALFCVLMASVLISLRGALTTLCWSLLDYSLAFPLDCQLHEAGIYFLLYPQFLIV